MKINLPINSFKLDGNKVFINDLIVEYEEISEDTREILESLISKGAYGSALLTLNMFYNVKAFNEADYSHEDYLSYLGECNKLMKECVVETSRAHEFRPLVNLNGLEIMEGADSIARGKGDKLLIEDFRSNKVLCEGSEILVTYDVPNEEAALEIVNDSVYFDPGEEVLVRDWNGHEYKVTKTEQTPVEKKKEKIETVNESAEFDINKIKNDLNRGNVIVISKKGYTPTSFIVIDGGIYFNNREISFGWNKHPSMNTVDELLDFIEKKSAEGFTIGHRITEEKEEKHYTGNSRAEEIVFEFKDTDMTLDNLFKAMNELSRMEFDNQISSETYEDTTKKVIQAYLDFKQGKEVVNESKEETKTEYQRYCDDLGIDPKKKSSKNRFIKDYGKHQVTMNGIKDFNTKVDQVKKDLQEEAEGTQTTDIAEKKDQSVGSLQKAKKPKKFIVKEEKKPFTPGEIDKYVANYNSKTGSHKHPEDFTWLYMAGNVDGMKINGVKDTQIFDVNSGEYLGSYSEYMKEALDVPRNHGFRGFMMDESGMYTRGNYVLIKEGKTIKAISKKSLGNIIINK